MSGGKQARVSPVMYAPSLLIYRKISKWEYVKNGLWEGDTDAPPFCSLPCTRDAILQSVYRLRIIAPWHFIYFYFYSYWQRHLV